MLGAALREQVCQANRELPTLGLVTLTWGNVSGFDSDQGWVAIKPSGVPYGELRPADIVLLDLEGRVLDGELRPSTDTPAHLVLYRAWGGATEKVGGICHTHSELATAFAQARMELPCFGTTHADHFDGPVPLTRQLRPEEVASGYEAATGQVLVERFAGSPAMSPRRIPAALVPGHGPFTWGADAAAALNHAVALEAVAKIAHAQLALGRAIELEEFLRAKHQQRKHGRDAYYGQIR
ncbi:MAG: L-ribulose-5-phosphate 4-epimerase AraD [Planctomycetota bacterium]|nr:MAG: L-ribulose-5-phosphate 4-epimerase AraD [Planctomycetota bacterium]